MATFEFTYTRVNSTTHKLTQTTAPIFGDDNTINTTIFSYSENISKLFSNDGLPYGWINENGGGQDGTLTFTATDCGFTSPFINGVYRASVSFIDGDSINWSGTSYLLDVVQLDDCLAKFYAKYGLDNCSAWYKYIKTLQRWREYVDLQFTDANYDKTTFFIQNIERILNQFDC